MKNVLLIGQKILTIKVKKCICVIIFNNRVTNVGYILR
jgi:hypothetical protein